MAFISGEPARVTGALRSGSSRSRARASLCSQKQVLKRATVTRAGSPEMKAMLLYSTTTGNTETAAGYIADATGLEAVDIGDASVDDIKAAESLIIGAPTWHTGADSERSGTAWDEFLYGDLTGLDLAGKKVAIFGMGDQA